MTTNDISSWYSSIPQITRYWFTGSVVLPLMGKLGLVSVYNTILSTDFIYRFQIWRPLTSLLFYPLSPGTGFHYLINLFFLYNYSTRLESGVFDGRPADYLCLLTFNWLVLVGIGLCLGLPLLMDPMILSVLYIWCQLNRDQIVSFWFGTQFKAMYLPWVLCAFNMILMNGGMVELLGILVGHLYFFLKFKYPQDFGGTDFLQTPQFLYTYFPNRRTVGGFGSTPWSRPTRRQEEPADRAPNWGPGRRLDD